MISGTPFSRALHGLARDLRLAGGCRLVWKAAEPAHWDHTPVELGQHRHPHCLSVKRDPARRARCLAHDNVLEKDLPRGAVSCLRTCPFGVTDLLVPVYAGDRYLGALELGGWKGRRGPGSLDPFPGKTKAAALGRLALASMIPLHNLLDAEGAYHRSGSDTLMAQSVTWIGDHLSAELRAAHVARVAELSVSRFLHRFKDATGETFHRHVERRLMSEACRRLMAGNDPVEGVADSLGYRDGAAFQAAFRRAMGKPPGAWRKERAKRHEP